MLRNLQKKMDVTGEDMGILNFRKDMETVEVNSMEILVLKLYLNF